MCEKCADDKSISWALYDARGLYVSRVCESCESEVKKGFRPEIFTDSDYSHDEPIDSDDDYLVYEYDE